MSHSKEYEKMRRKLGVHKKTKPGDLLGAVHHKLALGEPVFKRKHRKEVDFKKKKEIDFKHRKSESFAQWAKEESKESEHKKRKGMKPIGAHGRAAVHALGRTKKTGNFAKIAASKGKGAAIAAYQNVLAKHEGKAAPFHRKHHKMACKKEHTHTKACK